MISFIMSVRPPSVRMEQICFHYLDFREVWCLSTAKICRENEILIKNLTTITGTLHEYLGTFMVISRLILLTRGPRWHCG
jgi:hypothetical protein